MRKRIIIITLGLAASFAVFGYMYFAKYSISEIHADNFLSKLEASYNKNVFCCGTTSFLEDPMFLLNAIDGQSSEFYKYNKFEGSFGSQIVEINNPTHHVMYSVAYDKKGDVPFSFSVSEWPLSDDYSGTVKKYLHELLLRGEFSLKRTELINGKNDLIIKDNGDYFITGLIIGRADNPFGIRFEVFKKRKFFKDQFE